MGRAVTQHPGKGLLGEDEGVESLAVGAHRVGDEPVVGGIDGGREQPPVEAHPLALRVVLVLLPAPLGGLDEDIDQLVLSAHGGDPAMSEAESGKRVTSSLVSRP